ncbi:hypothetical protein [Flavobacterium sp. ZS1P14]
MTEEENKAIIKKIAPATKSSELKTDENIRKTLAIDSFDTLK